MCSNHVPKRRDLPGKKRCVLKLSVSIVLIVISAVLSVMAAPASAQAQSPAASPATTGTLRGQVTDPSGAVVANTTVAILESGGPTHSATTNRSGNYEIGSLTPGKYTVDRKSVV